MAKKIDPRHVEAALAEVTDESSFIQKVLIDLLNWPIDPKINTVEEIGYDWTKDELRAANLDKKVVEGRIRQQSDPFPLPGEDPRSPGRRPRLARLRPPQPAHVRLLPPEERLPRRRSGFPA
jgi:hypothetical protein